MSLTLKKRHRPACQGCHGTTARAAMSELWIYLTVKCVFAKTCHEVLVPGKVKGWKLGKWKPLWLCTKPCSQGCRNRQTPQHLDMATKCHDGTDCVCWHIMQALSQALYRQLKLAQVQQSSVLPTSSCSPKASHNPEVDLGVRLTSDGVKKGTFLLCNLSVFDCPRFGAIRAQNSNLFQDAEGSMHLFMWHKDQKAVSHCLTAILQMAQT